MASPIIIHDPAPLGDGIHSAGRERVYVERNLPGDIVDAIVKEAPGGTLRGDVLRIVQNSPHRVEAACSNYDVCGGCTLQYASEEFYRAWKIETVRNALRRKNLDRSLGWTPYSCPRARAGA